MISYTLKCEHNHIFDSWFQSAEAFEKLMAADMVTCSTCGTIVVEKAIMAPRVRPARNAAKPIARILSAPASPADQALLEMRKIIEANSEDVGDKFAIEARKIHDGDSPERSIIGKAKPEEAKALIDEGIPVAPLPWGRKKGAN